MSAIGFLPAQNAHFANTILFSFVVKPHRDILTFLQLGEDALVVRTTEDGSLDLAITKSWIFTPGTPFIDDAVVSFCQKASSPTTL
jgi:hypothetical protein